MSNHHLCAGETGIFSERPTYDLEQQKPKVGSPPTPMPQAVQTDHISLVMSRVYLQLALDSEFWQTQEGSPALVSRREQRRKDPRRKLPRISDFDCHSISNDFMDVK